MSLSSIHARSCSVTFFGFDFSEPEGMLSARSPPPLFKEAGPHLESAGHRW